VRLKSGKKGRSLDRSERVRVKIWYIVYPVRKSIANCCKQGKKMALTLFLVNVPFSKFDGSTVLWMSGIPSSRVGHCLPLTYPTRAH